MTEKEVQEVLKWFYNTKHEQLKEEAGRLFDAIMKIADRRDEVEYEYDRDTHILQNRLDLANAKNIEKDKIIDLMTEEFKEKTLMYSYFSKKEIKQYFERKAKELNNEKN